MPDHDAFTEHGRSLEEDYFRKKDRELIAKIRQAAAAGRISDDLRDKTGLEDPALIQELRDLGFTPDTVGLLPLVPVLQMAWAEGGITKAERELILRLARSRGVEEGSAADHQLTQWMAHRPDDAVLAGGRRLIRAMIDSGSAQAGDLHADNLIAQCEQIAAASGGILGIGRISAEERALLSSIAADLHARRP